MTDEKTRALLAEAEKHIASTLSSIGAESSSVRAAWARCEGADERFALVVKLTAALSALTVPDGDAREALLRLNIAGEIEAEDEASGPFPDKANAYYDGLRRAAEIVRRGR